ncbi:MMPL family transporter [Acaricomes phytoseiuli]|uniref:MMPL family transporter n=1 Tax=Acaricomes phytoseiuli TaxID=291968 RepID=UPI00037FA1C5|nr:MMPL family transporter [Acaricomes phytoseiuli]MCW1248964.1 MMPL family transporter [Acaricomes phytoseiuli]
MAFVLYRLGKFAATYRWAVIAAWLIILLAVGASAAAFRGQLTNNFQIPGTETQQMLDKLEAELPQAAGGSGGVVFESPDGFTQAQRDAVAQALTELEAKDYVQSTVDPFQQQQQLDNGPAQLADGRQQLAAGETQLEQTRAQLDTAKVQLDAAQGQVSQAQDAGVPVPDAQLAQLSAQQAQYDAGEARWAAAQAQLNAQRLELDTAAQQLRLSDGLRFVSENNTVALARIQFTQPLFNLDSSVRQEVQDMLSQAVSEAGGGLNVFFSREITEDVSQIFGVAEIIGIVIAAVVLLVMLGTLVAAGLPLLMAVIGVAVGIGGTLALSGLIEMNSVTPALGLMIGLAVGIDYSLFIINRHRQQLLAGMPVRESIATATGTSGNAVLFAGLTVVIALAALTLSGLPFLMIMGLSAAATVLIAVLIALTLTPAMLSLIGRRLISRRAWRRAEAHPGEQAEQVEAKTHRPQGSGWGGLVTRHPVITLLAGVAVLGLVALPATQLRLALPDGSSEPVGSSSYEAFRLTEENFGAGANGPIVVVGQLPSGLSQEEAQSKQFDVADDLGAVPGVVAAVPVALSQDQQVAAFQVIPEEGPASAETVQVIKNLRAQNSAIEAETGVSIGLTGQTAANVDVSAKLGEALPLYLTVVIGLSLVLLLMVFRSILVPLLATGGFLLSLAASFGAVVAVYQWGWLGEIFGVANPGAVLSLLPIILIGVLFGLAMDYQVFIVSGMREAFVHGEDARQAVRTGFSHAATVVVAAAIIMVSVFAGFIFSHLTMVRPLGFALALGVLIDAFVVRMTLIPAAMRLLGRSAWWLPCWLDRILPDVDVEGAKVAQLASETTKGQATAEQR